MANTQPTKEELLQAENQQLRHTIAFQRQTILTRAAQQLPVLIDSLNYVVEQARGGDANALRMLNQWNQALVDAATVGEIEAPPPAGQRLVD